jgi:putative ABC transport system substrate-binding protein
MKRYLVGVFVFISVAVSISIAFSVQAQQTKKIPQAGYLAFVESPDLDGAFRKGLKELGYAEGRNIHIEYRYAGAKPERLSGLAAELVALKVDVIVASSTQATDAARKATKTIPIVFPITFDPVGSGFVASLARPGGNLTGLSALNPEVMGKRVELLKEIVPQLSRAAVLWNPTNSGSKFALSETETAAKHLGIRLQIAAVRNVDELEEALRAALKEKAGALIQIPDNFFNTIRPRIVEFAMKNRLPSIYSSVGFAEAGGLMAYGASTVDLYRRAATYVDKILRGAKPSDLPVEQATKFELTINLKTAKQIGVTVPPNMLARADKVIK